MSEGLWDRFFRGGGVGEGGHGTFKMTVAVSCGEWLVLDVTYSEKRRKLFHRLGILNIFQITKVQLGELIFKYQNNLLLRIYGSFFCKS